MNDTAEKPVKRSCKIVILERLRESDKPLAPFEFNTPTHFTGYSENTIASRLPDLARDGKIAGRFRDGKPFKEWFLVKAGQIALPGVGA